MPEPAAPTPSPEADAPITDVDGWRGARLARLRALIHRAAPSWSR